LDNIARLILGWRLIGYKPEGKSNSTRCQKCHEEAGAAAVFGDN
jgi:hypothetical protein